MVAVGAIAVIAGPVAPAGSVASTSHAPATFLTVQVKSFYRGLALRSTTDGHVIRRLLPRRYLDVSATVAADGSVLASWDLDSCRSAINRIDPATGARQRVATVDEDVNGLTLSPDGEHVAYLTYPECQPSSGTTGTTAGGPIGFLPNVLVIRDLTSGAEVSTATNEPGQPFFGFSFSPNGRKIVAGYYGDGSLRIMSAAHPDFARSRALAPGRHCQFSGAAWTRQGIVTGMGCGRGIDPSPHRVVRLDAAGHLRDQWRLPDCVNGFGLEIDANHTDVLVEDDVGYGLGRCGHYWATRIDRLASTGLAPVLEAPGQDRRFYLATW